ncbi:hypothetical protein GCM10010109_22630 [Actinoplanes campanulatus]|nr:hypothetical protein GCM10010109_22630 [Actinoplanes campanulatus]GID37025.1 hypothetical protein Aca09nite_35310 [Actinoplanes campanulatus]
MTQPLQARALAATRTKAPWSGTVSSAQVLNAMASTAMMMPEYGSGRLMGLMVSDPTEMVIPFASVN